jgi:hypothetical protein
MTEGRRPIFMVNPEGKTEDEITDEVIEQLRAAGIEVRDSEEDEDARGEAIAAQQGMELPEERWDTDGLGRDFEILGFLAPFRLVVRRKSDGVKGSLEYTRQPRWYFNFQPD